MVNLIVIKKNGKKEKFDIMKLIASCTSAGLSKKIAMKIATEITDELHNIPSYRIRSLVLTKMKKLKPEVANSIIKHDLKLVNNERVKLHEFFPQ